MCSLPHSPTNFRRELLRAALAGALLDELAHGPEVVVLARLGRGEDLLFAGNARVAAERVDEIFAAAPLLADDDEASAFWFFLGRRLGGQLELGILTILLLFLIVTFVEN